MKRILCLIMTVLFIAAMSACSAKNRPANEPDPTQPPYNYDSPANETTAPEQQPDYTQAPDYTKAPDYTQAPIYTDAPEPTSEPENGQKVNFRFVTKTYTWEEADGYTFEATFRVSPWIAVSNTATLNAAWQEVGKGYTLPTTDDWDMIGSWPDMYYCVGQIKIKNTTRGWDITADRSRSTMVFMDLFSEEPTVLKGLLYYSSTSKLTNNRLEIFPKMTSNNWGPVTFVLMTPEYYSPNYPQGQYFDSVLNGDLAIYNWSPYQAETCKVGVIDNEKYYPPTD